MRPRRQRSVPQTLEKAKQPRCSLILACGGRGDSWPADGWHKHFIDFFIRCRRDLIEIQRFLTSVSASQQGCCCAQQPHLGHPLPNSLLLATSLLRMGMPPERDVLTRHTVAGPGGMERCPGTSSQHGLMLSASIVKQPPPGLHRTQRPNHRLARVWFS